MVTLIPSLLLCLVFISSDRDWKSELGEERYHVMRQKGTERAFRGIYTYQFQEGTYLCYACNQPLFDSKSKYLHRGSGWPCFQEPINAKNIYYLKDTALPIQRYEVLCRGCDSHLGHLFHDGPLPKKNRYLINSISLRFIPRAV